MARRHRPVELRHMCCPRSVLAMTVERLSRKRVMNGRRTWVHGVAGMRGHRGGTWCRRGRAVGPEVERLVGRWERDVRPRRAGPRRNVSGGWGLAGRGFVRLTTGGS